MSSAITNDGALLFEIHEDYVADAPGMTWIGARPDPLLPSSEDDGDPGALVVFTKGVKGMPRVGYTMKIAITADALRDALQKAGYLQSIALRVGLLPYTAPILPTPGLERKPRRHDLEALVYLVGPCPTCGGDIIRECGGKIEHSTGLWDMAAEYGCQRRPDVTYVF